MTAAQGCGIAFDPNVEATCSAAEASNKKDCSRIVKTGSSTRRKRCRSEERVAEAGKEWKSANIFRSIPPRTTAGEGDRDKDAYDEPADEANDVELREEAACKFGSMRILPLEERPYYKEGFIRLPALPSGNETQVETLHRYCKEAQLLQELQENQPLSRFDSVQGLRIGDFPASRIVVFRRIRKWDDERKKQATQVP